MDFRKATDDLFSPVSHADLAKALGVSVPLVRQARLDEKAKAHRTAPEGWEKAIIRIAEKRIRQYESLIRRLGKHKGDKTSAADQAASH